MINLLTVTTTFAPSLTVPDVSAAPQVDTGQLNSFFSIVSSVWSLISSITWAGVPVTAWLIGGVVVGIIVGIIKGRSK